MSGEAHDGGTAAGAGGAAVKPRVRPGVHGAEDTGAGAAESAMRRAMYLSRTPRRPGVAGVAAMV